MLKTLLRITLDREVLTEFKWTVDKMGAGYALSIKLDHELGLNLKMGRVES